MTHNDLTFQVVDAHSRMGRFDEMQRWAVVMVWFVIEMSKEKAMTEFFGLVDSERNGDRSIVWMALYKV